MLDLTNMDTDDLYWAAEVAAPTPKCKHAQADDELLDDSVSMVKMAASHKNKTLKPMLKTPSMHTMNEEQQKMKETNATTVVSQSSAISQLTEQVLQIKLKNKQLLDCFDRLAAQMEQFMSNQTSQTTRRHARGHRSESCQQT